MPAIDQYLQDMLEKGGSALHLCAGRLPKYRISDGLVPVGETLPADVMEEMLREICPPDRWEIFAQTGNLDLIYAPDRTACFHADYFYHYAGLGAVFRLLPGRIPSLEELAVPGPAAALGDVTGGLVLVTGPAGAGKSAVLAALIDRINAVKCQYVVTLEDPVSFIHADRRSIIVQQEIGIHSHSFPDALRTAMRSGPDVILINPLKDLETIRLALSAAAMGCTVFGAMTTGGAAKTVAHIISIFPAGEQPLIRSLLADSLRGLLFRRLCRKNDGSAVPVHELLLYSGALPAMIRGGDPADLTRFIEANREYGMFSLNDSLAPLLSAGELSVAEALLKADDPDTLRAMLEAAAAPPEENSGAQ